MASEISGAKELHRDKPKWGENLKVYTRKIHVNSNKNVVTSDKNDRETTEKIAVESSGGVKNHVVNGTSTVNNVGKNSEIVVEEVPDNENNVKEGPTVLGNNVGKKCESVVEEVPSNENTAGEMAATTDSGRIENEASAKTGDDEKIIEEVPINMNSVKEVLNVVDNGKETLCAENKVEEVPDTGNIMKEVTENEHNKDVSEDMICSEAHKRMTNDESLHNEHNVVEGPQYEKNIEEVPDDDVEIREKVPMKMPVEEAKLAQASHIPSNVETLTVSDDLTSHGLVEAPLPNGHDNLENGAIREERSMASQVDDDILNNNVTAAKSKDEVRDLKRKLESKLDQVRKMAKKLQAKENQLSSTDFDSGRLREEPPAVVGRLRFPVNGGLGNDVTSMAGNENSSYVDYNTPRPLIQRLSSATNNSYHSVGENVHEKEKRTPRANQLYQNSDFLLAKDKFPPASSNKKAKSSGGSRKHGGDLSSGFGFDKKFHKKCSDLLQKLRKHKHGWVFNVPVDVKRLGLHDYFDIIKHPMDLGTVKTRLTNNWYKTPREFAEDVRLTFHNAMTYNPEGQDVHIMAKDLLRIFEDKWPSIEADYDRKLRYEMFRDVGTPTPTSRKLYAPSHLPIHMPLPPPPLLRLPQSFQDARNYERSQSMPARPASRPKPTPSVVRTPAPKKPKAREPNKRDMTYEEKQKLSTNLQCLPSDKLDAIVQIIKKRESSFSQHDDEIEVDIDKVDAETLWELDRFVNNFKKRLSKQKRKAEMAMQARAEHAAQAGTSVAEAVQETVPSAPVNVGVPREHKTDEGNVGASHVQQEGHNGNASDSSNTSSSSSDSGSSSSDSDSDSSSDSDSDDGR